MSGTAEKSVVAVLTLAILGGALALILWIGSIVFATHKSKSDTAAGTTSGCSTASLSTMADIGTALTTPKGRGLYDAVIVDLDTSNGGYTNIVAARINNGTNQPIGVWAYSASSIDSLNATALRYTEWGRATQPGSEGAATRSTLRESTEYAEAVACVPAA